MTAADTTKTNWISQSMRALETHAVTFPIAKTMSQRSEKEEQSREEKRERESKKALVQTASTCSCNSWSNIKWVTSTSLLKASGTSDWIWFPAKAPLMWRVLVKNDDLGKWAALAALQALPPGMLLCSSHPRRVPILIVCLCLVPELLLIAGTCHWPLHLVLL